MGQYPWKKEKAHPDSRGARSGRVLSQGENVGPHVKEHVADGIEEVLPLVVPPEHHNSNVQCVADTPQSPGEWPLALGIMPEPDPERNAGHDGVELHDGVCVECVAEKPPHDSCAYTDHDRVLFFPIERSTPSVDTREGEGDRASGDILEREE